jgi:hypothetical protein
LQFDVAIPAAELSMVATAVLLLVVTLALVSVSKG